MKFPDEARALTIAHEAPEAVYEALHAYCIRPENLYDGYPEHAGIWFWDEAMSGMDAAVVANNLCHSRSTQALLQSAAAAWSAALTDPSSLDLTRLLTGTAKRPAMRRPRVELSAIMSNAGRLGIFLYLTSDSGVGVESDASLKGTDYRQMPVAQLLERGILSAAPSRWTGATLEIPPSSYLPAKVSKAQQAAKSESVRASEYEMLRATDEGLRAFVQTLSRVCDVKVHRWPMLMRGKLKLVSVHERVCALMPVTTGPLVGQILTAEHVLRNTLACLGVASADRNEAIERLQRGQTLASVAPKNPGPRSLAKVTKALADIQAARAYARRLNEHVQELPARMRLLCEQVRTRNPSLRKTASA
ncbi:hypothetical protein D3C71_19970 [compost metagenome]